MPYGVTIAPDSLITVDAGWSTACATWSGQWVPQVEALNLPSNMRGSKATTEAKLSYMWGRFADVMHNNGGIDLVVIEDVELWSEALVSLTAAERGDLFTLAKLIGGYCNECDSRDVRFELVMAKTWKGQLTKLATRKRVERFWRGIGEREYERNISDHKVDAIGIGLYKAGVF